MIVAISHLKIIVDPQCWKKLLDNSKQFIAEYIQHFPHPFDFSDFVIKGSEIEFVNIRKDKFEFNLSLM